MLKLNCQAGSKIGHHFKVVKSRYTIGRQAGNDLQLPSPFVSKFHAEIRRDENGEYWIEDLKSTNGTFIDKTEVSQATRLENGVTIIVGKSDIFKIEIIQEPANIPAYFNINDNLDIQPEVLKSKLKLSAMRQPTTRPITDDDDAPPENVSDSWLNLMNLDQEAGHEFKYPEDAFETQTLNPSRSSWPDVVKMSQKLDTYKKLHGIALVLLTLADKHAVIEKLDKIFNTILRIQTGVIVLHEGMNDPGTWETHFIGETDHQLMEISMEIHQSKKGSASEAHPYKSKTNGLLYHPLHDGRTRFGFITLTAAIASEGFLAHEKRGFRLVCDLLEKTLARFRKV